MKEYQIIVKKNNRYHKLTQGMINDYRIVRQGFSWQAFLFNALWFLSKRMWSKAITILLFIAIVQFLYLDLKIKINIILFSLIYIGIKASQWQIEFLIKYHEFVKEDLVIAKNNFEAEYLALKLLIQNYPQQVTNIIEVATESHKRYSFIKQIKVLLYKIYHQLTKFIK